MLGAFNKLSGSWISKLLLLLIIASFAVWGIEGYVRSGGAGGNHAAVVGDKKISRAAFERQYRREQERLREQLGANYSPELLKTFQLGRQVLQRMVNDEVIVQEAYALGIAPSDSDVAAALGRDAIFLNDKGKFDPQRFHAILRENGMTEAMYVEELKRVMAMRTLLGSIGAAAPLPPVMLETAYAIQHESRNVDLVVLQPGLVKGIDAPAEETLQAFYKEHQERFMTPEYRTIGVIVADKGAVEKSIEVTDDDVQRAYDEMTIMFGDAGSSTVAPLDKVRPMLESQIRAQKVEPALSALSDKAHDLFAGGATLDEAASGLGFKAYTYGPVNAEGKSQDGAKVALPAYEGFLDAAFKLEEQSESSFTAADDAHYYLMRVESVMPPAAKPFESVKSEVTAAWMEQQRSSKLAELANDVAKKLAEKDARKAALSEHGLTPANATLKREDEKAAGYAIPGAFRNELFSVQTGNSTQAYPMENGAYVIGIVQSRTPASMPKDANNTELAEFRKSLETDMQGDLIQQYVRSLQKKYPVEMNEALLSALTDEP